MTSDTLKEIAEIEAEATAALSSAADLAALEEAEREAFRSKRSRSSTLYQQLGSMPPDQRRDVGRLMNELRSRLQAIADTRRDSLGASARTERLAADRLDLTEVLPGRLAGDLHLVTQVREALEDVFVGMGYEIAEGPEVETGWRNFEALNIPEDHPARSPLDTSMSILPSHGACCCALTHRQFRSGSSDAACCLSTPSRLGGPTARTPGLHSPAGVPPDRRARGRPGGDLR